MSKSATSRQYEAVGRDKDPGGEERRERALLEEFNRTDSVAALAARIAARLGRKTRSDDLIADAGLPATKCDR